MRILLFLAWLPGIIHQSATLSCPSTNIICDPGEICTVSSDCVPPCSDEALNAIQSCEVHEDCPGEQVCSAAHFCFLPCGAEGCAAGCTPR
jgi:hypothetical protein